MYRHKYNTVTGEFLGLQQTLGYLRVHSDANKSFFDYRFSEEVSKILHSFHRRNMLSSFLEHFSIGIARSMNWEF